MRRPDFRSRCVGPGGEAVYDAAGRVLCAQQDDEGTCTHHITHHITSHASHHITSTQPHLAAGYLSFPSGHSAAATVLGVFMAVYLLWTLHVRAVPNQLRTAPNVAACPARLAKLTCRRSGAALQHSSWDMRA